MKYVSLFSGIEAASVAWGPLGWEPLAFSEIDAFPCAVLAERFPGVPNLGDITKIDWKKAVKTYGKPDVVVGGSPCQAFSVAGLREGLKDPRGNLMLEWLRVVDEVKPEFALWENVPGVLSDKTGAFRTLLDSLQSLGYIIDMDILDAQYFGVAQRRKRVFVLGWRAETLLKRKTSTSRTIMAQILGKILLSTLEGLLAESEKERASSDCAESSRGGLLKRMKSFGLRTEEDLLMWLRSLEGEKGRLALELKNLATPLGMKSRDMLDTEATSVFERMENERSFTELLWRTISGETSDGMNAYTTSTSTNLTTRSRIFICSTAGLIIARLISHWKQLDRVYCNEGLYISTLLKEFTSYAIRENERAGLFNGFDDVLAHIGREAERQEKIIRDLGNERGREIQLEPESLRWDFGSSREKRKALASGADGSPRAAGFKFHQGSGAGNIGYEDELSPTLIADWHNPAILQITGNAIGRAEKNGPGGRGWCDPDDNGAYSLTACDHHAVIAPTAKTLQVRCGKEGGGKGALVQDDLSATLSTSNVQTLFKPVAFAANQRGEVRLQGGDGDVTGAVPASQSGKQVNGVVCGYEVRRLTPREFERLQGFPDDWTLITWKGKPADECPDGPRYKAIGNSMAVPVMRWIGERIELAERGA